MNETYKKVRVDPNGKVILERLYTTEIDKEEVLEGLQNDLDSVTGEITRAEARKARIETKIADVTKITAASAQL